FAVRAGMQAQFAKPPQAFSPVLRRRMLHSEPFRRQSTRGHRRSLLARRRIPWRFRDRHLAEFAEGYPPAVARPVRPAFFQAREVVLAIVARAAEANRLR